MYQTLTKIAKNFFNSSQIFKHGFNLSPMYRRSTAKIIFASKDLHVIKVKIKRSWKNKNYMGSIFGGSLFSATDPIYMIQLINILGNDYVVWDKSTNIRFKRPAYKDAFAEFVFSTDEITKIQQKVAKENEIDYIKNLHITDVNGTVFCELEKTIYVANKKFYQEKRKRKQAEKKI